MVTHKVLSQVVEVVVRDQDQADKACDEGLQFFHERILPVLEAELDLQDVPGSVIEIESLSFDFGNIRNFAGVSEDSIRKVVKDAIEEVVTAAKVGFGGQKKAVIREMTVQNADMLLHFLEFGELPWQVGREESAKFHPWKTLSEALQKEPIYWRESLSALIRRVPAVARRIALQASSAVFEEIIKTLGAQEFAAIWQGFQLSTNLLSTLISNQLQEQSPGYGTPPMVNIRIELLERASAGNQKWSARNVLQLLNAGLTQRYFDRGTQAALALSVLSEVGKTGNFEATLIDSVEKELIAEIQNDPPGQDWLLETLRPVIAKWEAENLPLSEIQKNWVQSAGQNSTQTENETKTSYQEKSVPLKDQEQGSEFPKADHSAKLNQKHADEANSGENPADLRKETSNEAENSPKTPIEKENAQDKNRDTSGLKNTVSTGNDADNEGQGKFKSGDEKSADQLKNKGPESQPASLNPEGKQQEKDKNKESVSGDEVSPKSKKSIREDDQDSLEKTESNAEGAPEIPQNNQSGQQTPESKSHNEDSNSDLPLDVKADSLSESTQESLKPEELAKLPLNDRWRAWKKIYDETPEKLYPKPSDPIPFYTDKPFIFGENAGLVLLWPFISHLFKALGLITDTEFATEAQRDKAIALLHFIATGKAEDIQEHSLIIPKLLCGMGVNEAWSPQDLSEAEKEAGIGLLKAAITHWAVLGGISPEGFRDTFLLREGKVSFDGSGIVIYVERKALDILMERMPWGISTIKLPWQPQIIHVQW